ncbi:hypothetical protein [Effusibacillus dendaii]|uniref:Uncharacterized protein n=1 Tax=Effusibacillus dendaii TaxID=2743772 RepID=A0A7I8D4M9_9BACL|nr:hypothetical protein [Effusibacillus dendaii]BCJ85017.1 hypothetical protein skT53_00020 [Effusibacillus dendaii]
MQQFFNQISDIVVRMKVETENRFRYEMANESVLQKGSVSRNQFGKLVEEVHPKEYASFLNQKYSQVSFAKTSITFEDESTVPVGRVIGQVDRLHLTGQKF